MIRGPKSANLGPTDRSFRSALMSTCGCAVHSVDNLPQARQRLARAARPCTYNHCIRSYNISISHHCIQLSLYTPTRVPGFVYLAAAYQVQLMRYANRLRAWQTFTTNEPLFAAYKTSSAEEAYLIPINYLLQQAYSYIYSFSYCFVLGYISLIESLVNSLIQVKGRFSTAK